MTLLNFVCEMLSKEDVAQELTPRNMQMLITIVISLCLVAIVKSYWKEIITKLHTNQIVFFILQYFPTTKAITSLSPKTHALKLYTHLHWVTDKAEYCTIYLNYTNLVS